MKRDLVVGGCVGNDAGSVQRFRRSIETARGDIDRDIRYLMIAESAEIAALIDGPAHKTFGTGPKPNVTALVNDPKLTSTAGTDRILAFALAEQCDVVLVEPDTDLFPETLSEMVAIADSDSMIGFVAPLCNDGIAGQPHDNDTPEASFRAFQTISARLPRAAYVPPVLAPCLLVKLKILQDFGGFDSGLGPCARGLDLQLRANRYGYRTALANRAFCWHDGPHPRVVEQLGSLNQNDGETLRKRYPHQFLAIDSYSSSPRYRSFRLLSRVADAPLSVAFDLSNFGRRRDGTTEYGTRLLTSFARLFSEKYDISAICERSACKHHGLDGIAGIRWSAPDSEELFSAVIRPSQPFDPASARLGASKGAVSIVAMLDCIAYDCLNLSPPELESLWRFVLGASDGIVYVSDFSRRQFAARFPGERRDREIVSMPSTDIHEYGPPKFIPPGDYLLIVGNSFAHKAVREAVEIVQHALPDRTLKVLGVKLRTRAVKQSYDSGTLTPSVVSELFAHSCAVIYPSHYEGFGFPVLHALGNRRPIFVRDLPVFAEIKQRVVCPQNIHVFGSNGDLAKMLTQENFQWNDRTCEVGDVGWDRSARELEELLVVALASTTADKIERRLEQLDLITDAFAGSQNRVRQLEERIRGFELSTSWRITAPLRKLKTWIS